MLTVAESDVESPLHCVNSVRDTFWTSLHGLLATMFAVDPSSYHPSPETDPPLPLTFTWNCFLYSALSSTSDPTVIVLVLDVFPSLHLTKTNLVSFPSDWILAISMFWMPGRTPRMISLFWPDE